MDEGVAQLFTLDLNGRKIIGHCRGVAIRGDTVPPEHEYGAKMHIRASTGIQSVLGAAGRPCRRGVC